MRQVGKLLLIAFACATFVNTECTKSVNNIKFLEEDPIKTDITRELLNTKVQEKRFTTIKGLALLFEDLTTNDENADEIGGIEDIPETNTNYLINYILSKIDYTDDKQNQLTYRSALLKGIEKGYIAAES